MKPVAALFVENGGVYFNLPNVEPWAEHHDARNYRGPHPVVAHPPCKRWGRFWHGSTRKPHQFRLGEDGGCFACAITSARNYGGVVEHPGDSHAWRYFGLREPSETGWTKADDFGGWTCRIEQGFYGHFSRKVTWLYVVGVRELPELRWGRGEQRLHPVALEKHGYEKARRIGMVAMIGGKDKEKIRDRTPLPFRDVLLKIARNAA